MQERFACLTKSYRVGILYKSVCRCGGIGRRKGLKIPRWFTAYRFKPGQRHQKSRMVYIRDFYIFEKFDILRKEVLKLRNKIRQLFSNIRLSYCMIIICSSAFLAFGLYEVHSLSGVTEGGVLGLTLLLQHWFDISPSVSNFILSALCYLMGVKILGKDFIIYSIISTVSFSAVYAFWEQFDPLWPQLAQMPLVASIIGAIFVGVGCGFCVRVGGATGGDDALAMSLAYVTKIDIQWIYLISDFTVLALSLSYIPWTRIMYSVLTVILSGQIIGWIQKLQFPLLHPRCEEKVHESAKHSVEDAN